MSDTPQTDAFEQKVPYSRTDLLAFARKLERDFNDAMNGAEKLYKKLKATPPEALLPDEIIEKCAALCDAVKERSAKAFYGPGMEHLHPQVKGEWEASKVLGDQIRALKAGVSPLGMPTEEK